MTYEKQLAHLVMLATQPGWKDYAWQRAKALETCSTGLWAGMAAALTQEMRARLGLR